MFDFIDIVNLSGLVFPLISRRKFYQIDVLEGLNVLIGINGRKNKLRIYYLTWLKQKILKGDEVIFLKQILLCREGLPAFYITLKPPKWK